MSGDQNVNWNVQWLMRITCMFTRSLIIVKGKQKLPGNCTRSTNLKIDHLEPDNGILYSLAITTQCMWLEQNNRMFRFQDQYLDFKPLAKIWMVQINR